MFSSCTNNCNNVLSRLGKQVIFSCTHILYDAIKSGAEFLWPTNCPLTLEEVIRVQKKLINDTYNEDAFVKNFVWCFCCVKFSDLCER